MKKLFLFIAILCMGILHGLAQTYDYTDKNGVTWTYGTNQVYDSETSTYRYYANITAATGFGEEVVMPDTVYNDDVAYAVASLGESLFKDNETIKKVTLAKGITSLNPETFSGCSSLVAVENTEQITYIGQKVFYDCTSLASMDLPKCTSVESNAFSGCTSLASMDLPKCTSVESNAFSGCTSLTSMNLPKCTSVSSYAFQNCTSLESINLPLCTTIEWGAFNYCTSLTSVDLPLCKSVENSAFSSCTSLASVNLPLCTSVGRLTFSGCTSLTSMDLPKCKSVGYDAFKNCTSLTSVDLPLCKSVETSIFSSCTNLTSINLPNCTTIGSSAFCQCTNLTSINLPNCTTIGSGAFYQCTSLASINLPNCTTIGSGAFYSCTSLTSVKLPKCKIIPDGSDYYPYSNGVFQNCKKLQSFDFSNIESIGSVAFYGCNLLKDISLPNCTSIGNYAFYGCDLLKDISLPNCTSIGNYAFYGCDLLKDTSLPNCTSIGDGAFYGCDLLKDVSLPATLQKIGNYCFSGDVLVTLYSEVPPTSTSDNGTISFDNLVTFKVPEASLEAYRTAEAWKDLKSRIFPIGAVLDYDVTATALGSTSGLANAIGKDNLDKVVSLKVSGTINSYDIMMIRNKMDNLHHLDLANANIVANSYQYYTGCSSEDSIVGANAFRELDKLVTVKLPKSAKEIKDYAFYNCRSLTSIVMPEKLKYLDDGVFAGCYSLADVDFISCERIGSYAFGDYQGSTQSLKKLVLPSNLKEIGSSAFYNSGLQRVEFPPTLQTIGNSAFASCNSLDSISLPAVTRIGENAFQGCSGIHEVRIPSSLEEIGNGAFQCSNMNNVYAYTVQPVHINQNTFSNYSTATLHVPEQSFDNYYWDTEWSQFRSMEPFDEPYTFFYVSKAYTLQSRFSGKPSIDIRPTGGLVVLGDEVQNADSIHIEGSAGSDIGTILANGNLNGEKLYIDITKNANQWYFFSFPFDVKLKNVRTRGDYVWRKYNGAVRAANGNGGWAELDKDDEWLHRGEGYAFQSATNGTLTIIVEKEQLNDFIADNVSTPLASYASDNTQNASWNFIGNPHTGYFDLNDLGYDAPVTYWNGSSYVAVRPGDDDYVFKPLQAFFVQKPETADNVEFDGDKRLTKEDSEQRTKASKVRRMARGINANRQFVNLAIASADGTDHTRIVYNDTRSNAYEMECDAAKFLSMTDAPQIYTVEAGNTRLAINERPMGSVSLAFKAQHAGEFSISATRMDIPMLLKDNLTGTTFDLTLGDYTFTSEEGTHDGRFMLMPNNSATGIGEIAKKSGVSIIGSSEGIYISGTNGKEVSVYTIDGMLLATRSTDGLLQLSNGVYVVNVDGMTAKVMVK